MSQGGYPQLNLSELQLVGGLPTLQAIEDVETDNKDRPIEEIRLIKATVFVNPFEEADEEVRYLRYANYFSQDVTTILRNLANRFQNNPILIFAAGQTSRSRTSG